MPVPARRLETGTIWVETTPTGSSTGRAVVYARVSSHDKRADLDRQVTRLTEWATSNGHEVAEVVCEVGCGFLRRILADPAATVVVAEHPDRLARFGAGYLQAALSAQGRETGGGRPR